MVDTGEGVDGFIDLLVVSEAEAIPIFTLSLTHSRNGARRAAAFTLEANALPPPPTRD